MKIAVVGSGFAGLALSWFYSKLGLSDTLTVFDPKPVEKRASSNAFLLHAFIHFKSVLNWKGREAFQAASELLEEVEPFSSEPFFIRRPFLKLANHPSQHASFIKAAELYGEVEWIEETPYGHPGLKVNEAYQLRSDLYLKALETGCRKRGVLFVDQKFEEKDEASFDQIIYASGDQTLDFFPDLPCEKIKGQTFTISKPPHIDLPCAITAYKCHIIPSFDQKTLILGSTFERHFLDDSPNIKKALELLNPHLSFMFPNLKEEDILSVSSGVRLNAQNRLPLLGQIDSKRWVFSAFGSKGMLYHAILGKALTQMISKNQMPIQNKLNHENLDLQPIDLHKLQMLLMNQTFSRI
jgi:glycine/D-amino acid oxidase-like deaminating enzyme